MCSAGVTTVYMHSRAPRVDFDFRARYNIGAELQSSERTRAACDAQCVHRNICCFVLNKNKRHNTHTQIDVMVLVTKNARYASDSMDGKTRTEAQLETDIITSYEEANNALADSGIDVTLRVVHIESVRTRGKLFHRRTAMCSWAVYVFFGFSFLYVAVRYFAG